MNGSKLLAKVIAVGVFIGVASARASSRLRRGPLTGSDTAIILGGTTEPTPSTAFAQAAENLYLHRAVSTMARPTRRSAT